MLSHSYYLHFKYINEYLMLSMRKLVHSKRKCNLKLDKRSIL